ncbi:type I DNA topoisomerase [Candidatus Paracaedibacter symbiosus]|uniref:type I DNA topoisomerase n=1 Tax=Candidatus Paracaedibacter symbiosus TaxID=244582 RepID=UPI00094E965F|nr:type I DNA topoisomerase [Candidatus Paracaedibacter symbiosus]
MKKVVVVESPAKAKTINRYLGNEFEVLASYGHIRDLPSKNGSVQPDDQFSMIWEMDDRSKKHVADIARALKNADELYLATDPDREGEAISWHVQEVLRSQGSLVDHKVRRIVFHEITKNAIQQALKSPRDINQQLVDAYLARRALDYLVGFTLSPVLWRKLPGSKSAGRVQSVSLRLIVQRENEIEAFKTQEYWSLVSDMLNTKDQSYQARLTYLFGKKLDKMDIKNEDEAQQAAKAILERQYSIKSVEKKQVKRNPAPPFTTSTLQQEASRKLGFSASRTMQIAQKLYEGVPIAGELTGLISYMRTDSVFISDEAIKDIRQFVGDTYGNNYVPATVRQFKNKAKNAQEAHEAIRPTSVLRHPSEVSAYLDDSQLKLYELIWKRTVASQIESAVFNQVGVDIESTDKQIILRATGSTLAFDGYLKVYQEGVDDAVSDDEDGRLLPVINEGEAATVTAVNPNQHFTQPPPRYTEASLVKKMEELGIGRPSTYASILHVLQERDYVRLEKRQFIPEDRGRMVTSFLVNFFKRYVEYDFTAHLEEELDEISTGTRKWRDVLTEFWTAFKGNVDGTKELRITEVLDSLEKDMAFHLFHGDEEGARKCPQCSEGKLSLKLSRYGAFIGCSNYPECKYTRTVGGDGGDNVEMVQADEPKVIGIDPATKAQITLRKGPYGIYLQWDGEVDQAPPPLETSSKGKKKNPKSISQSVLLFQPVLI